MNIYNRLTDEQLFFLLDMIENRVRWYEDNKPNARFHESAKYILMDLYREYDLRFPGQDWKSSVRIPK